MGTRWPLYGLMAKRPVGTPCFSIAPRSPASRASFCWSSSSSTCAFNSGLAAVNCATSACWGASCTLVAPKIVSTRVVKTRILTPLRSCFPWPSVTNPSHPSLSRKNSTSVPSLRPIQLRCMVRTFSGHPSSLSRPSSSSWAYAVMRKNHCTRSRWSTFVVSCRQQHPSTTCSLASTVAHSGHQFTLLFLR